MRLLARTIVILSIISATVYANWAAYKNPKSFPAGACAASIDIIIGIIIFAALVNYGWGTQE